MSFNITPVASGYQEIHPYSAMNIDSVKINTSLIMMKECTVYSNQHSNIGYSGTIMKSQIWDLVPNGTKVQIWSQKSPNFACKSQIAIREPQNGQKQPQNAINWTYEAISGTGGSKLVVQGGTRLVQGRKHH